MDLLHSKSTVKIEDYIADGIQLVDQLALYIQGAWGLWEGENPKGNHHCWSTIHLWMDSTRKILKASHKIYPLNERTVVNLWTGAVAIELKVAPP